MTETKYIVGAGGGKIGGGGTPTEADDTLQSKQFASVLDVISEGEIEGLEGGNKGIFLDDTPIEADDGSNNFEGFAVATRVGTQAQTHLAGSFNTTEREQGVGVKVLKDTPVTRSITDTDVDRLRVTLTIPSLQRVKDKGDIIGYRVSIKIQIQYNNGGYNDVIDDKITGKSSSVYQRDYLINLTGDFPVDVRMVRVSDDETSQKKANITIFQSYTEIIDEKFRYPNSALVGLRFDSSQFSSIPKRKYLIRGIKVKIPSNATVDLQGKYQGGLTYSGIWDGTFQAATWTNDPAWCLYDLLISERYGAGVPESTLDKYDFFAISQYCNELVDDGAGGQERRFSVNILINSREEVYNVIQQMTAIFRGIAYYGAGTLQLLQDKPSDPQYLLGPSNVVDGLFQYQGTSQKARHSVVVVAWQSYDTRGDLEYEYVEDHAAVAKYGIIKKDIKAIGCYSQGQAHRIGKWTLLSEQNLTETIQFSVALESGIVLRPGMVIDIADPVRSGARRSGRVIEATTTEITTDSADDLFLSLAAANNPKLSVILPTGLVEQRNVPVGGIKGVGGQEGSSVGDFHLENGDVLLLETGSDYALQGDLIPDGVVIDVISAFSEAPAVGSVFLFQNDDIQSQQFRVVSVVESGEGVFGVSAVAYNSTIYDAVENGNELTDRDISDLTLIPNPVDNISITEFLYEESNSVFVGAVVGWGHDRRNVSEFRVKYRIDDGNWKSVSTSSPSVTLRNLRAGRLYVQIQAKSPLGKGSQITSADLQLLGKTAAPANVADFSMIAVNGQARLTWAESTDLDVRIGGYVRLRHSPDLSGVTWQKSTSISRKLPGSATEAYADLKAGTYSAKFVDSGGRESLVAALIEFTKADLDSVEVVGALSSTEDPSFTGTKTNLTVDTVNNELELAASGDEGFTNGLFISEDSDSALALEDDSLLLQQGNNKLHTSGTYVFNGGNTFVLSDVFSIRLNSTVRARAFYPYGERIDDVPDFDSMIDFDGGEPNNCDVELYIRTTQDDPAGSPTFTSWRPFNNAEFKARGYQVKAEFSTGSSQEQISVDQLRIQAAMTRRSATGSVTTSTSADVSVAYGNGNKFYVTPSVGIVFTTNASGDYYVISNSSATGFDVSVYNSSNTRIAKVVNWTAVGYGIG